LEATLRSGHQARRSFDAARQGARSGTATIDLAAPGALTQLRTIGQQGGRVVALHGTRCQVHR
ncbi:MAG: hypothetical protein ACRDRA_07475, partial [Pseudonocardiaceae bacterium]